MNLMNISDDELEAQLKSAVQDETRVQLHVLHLLAEVERRRLYSKKHPSLFEYCVKILKYSAGAAQRRIDTMRAMKLIPEIENKIVSGELNLTSVSQAQRFWRHEAKTKKPYSLTQKKSLLAKLENKSTRECIETLVAISPQSVPQERRRWLTPDKMELRMSVDRELTERLDRLKALMSHKNPHMTDNELLWELAEIGLQKLDPLRQENKRSKNVSSTAPAKAKADNRAGELLPAPAVKSVNTSMNDLDLKDAGAVITRISEFRRSILLEMKKSTTPRSVVSAQIKRAVWIRDMGTCSFKDCKSQHFLEIDHIRPIALGGGSEPSNLRLVCRTHNQRAAIEEFGFEHMNRFIN